MLDPGDEFRIRYALALGCGAGLGAAVGALVNELLPHVGLYALRGTALGVVGVLIGIREAERRWFS